MGKWYRNVKTAISHQPLLGLSQSRRAVFMSEDKVHLYQPILSGINLTGSLYITCSNTALHKYVIVIRYYSQVFSSSHFLSVNMSLSLSITVPPAALSCPISTLQRTIFNLWDFGVGRITCDDIIMTFTFRSFWWEIPPELSLPLLRGEDYLNEMGPWGDNHHALWALGYFTNGRKCTKQSKEEALCSAGIGPRLSES